VYSVGPSIVDPRTGEIIDADISFAQEWVAAFAGQVTYQAPRASSGHVADEAQCMANNGVCGSKPERPASDQRVKGGWGCHEERLDEARDITAPLLRTLFTNGAGQLKVPIEVIGRGLAGVTVHEVGHTLGLRHNFKGSSTHPLDKIFTNYTLEHSSSSSVMDYVGAIVAPTAAEQNTTTIFPDGYTIGAYDYLAIQYGYTPVDGELPEEQHPAVNAIAKQLVHNHTYSRT
jgi:hypothetical protein